MRKRATIFATLLTVALVAGACGNGDGDVSVDTDRSRPELLYLGSHGAITAVSPRSGAIRFQQAGAVPSRDWSVLYAATNDGTSTTLRTLDPVTGAELASRTVPGVFTVRVVSEDGAAVGARTPDARRLRHLPSAEQGPHTPRDRAPRRSLPAGVVGGRERGTGGVLARRRRALRDRLRAAARTRALPRRPPRPRARHASATCATTSRSSRNRCAATRTHK